MKYDVIIVGAGPAGIFSAYEIARNTDLKILMLDKGPDLEKRKCPASRGFGCIHCEPCLLLSGWGGAGAFSDGKLTLSTDVGGWLNEYISKKELNELINYVDSVYLKFGATKHLYGADIEKVEEIERKASLAGLKLIHQKIRHMGTERCAEVLRKIRDELDGKVEVKLKKDVKGLIVKNNIAEGIETTDGEKYFGKYVVVAPGRSGAEWLQSEAQALGLRTLNNPVDVGIRVEILAAVMEELTNVLYEPKFIYYSKFFDDKVRTFCVAPYGEVITESYNGVLSVNGQSYAERKTENTNFAILVSTSFTEPFKEPIAYGKYLARLSNLLSGGVIVQRLGDLEAGRRSTPERIARSIVTPSLKNATPGDLSFVLPYRYLADIREMLQALDKIAPGTYSRDTLLYGVEVKFYSSRLQLSSCLETKIHNLFTIGDGAGVTRGLIQASASGVIAAREIMKREKQET
ncbi:NAD(P)/FAD-dependent oxidoreductase [Candidatus Bathyarchaeota archaeon]|nr:MAG: NAD(P)/FAD-dependent oxidoreductase [Candidatus Bathyarchaeota archaeon]RLI11607.1 MAG: FAD-dependent oxidoreductase [Candidatus Bathyarchaeota archaeon]RLI16578.1 MAG: FAD-dependent oxidoreductase [Candidatus Bathyarchaeota archaeon]RLI22715.1 MAG: FAD-dependent oxidoreductase [Candidatus Bathyarchaeota archaeon]